MTYIMNFNIHTGEISISPELRLYRGMRRRDLLSVGLSWEVWRIFQNEPTAYRLILPVADNGHKQVLYIIAYMAPNDGPLKRWDLLPKNGARGFQRRPEGKYTKSARIWFEKMCSIKLPQVGDWGGIDAEYDPHNLVAYIICIYREQTNLLQADPVDSALTPK